MTPARLFVLLTALFAALAAWFVPRMDASGDEPHYLLMAQSLWREGDLDLRDNYAREDWREYRGGPTEPHYAAPRLDGRPFPGHSPGLPFLLAPIYALGGRLACAILLAAMVAGVGALAFRLALNEGLDREAAPLCGVVAAGPPLAAYALHIYTEAPAAVATFAAYALLRSGGPWRSGVAAALACALPFLHPRMAVVSVALAIVAFILRDRVSLKAFGLVTALGLAVYAAFWMSIYGTPTGLGVYGGVPDDTTLNPFRAAIGLLLDRAYGILPIAPVFLLLALVTSNRDSGDASQNRAEWILTAAIVLPVLFWRMWWGGQSPPARLIAPLTPFLALAFARCFDRIRGVVFRRATIALVGVSWGLFLFAALQPSRLLFINRRVRPTRLWDALWPGGPLDALLPDMARPESSDWVIASVWIVILLAAAFVARRRAANPPPA
jgi:hypothetical protein